MTHHSPRFDRHSIATNTLSDASIDEDCQAPSDDCHGRTAGEAENPPNFIAMERPNLETFSTLPATLRPADSNYNVKENASFYSTSRHDSTIWHRHHPQFAEMKANMLSQQGILQRGEKELAVRTSQAFSGILFEKDKDRIIECQKSMRDTAGLEWWPPNVDVKFSALCEECQKINFKAAFHLPLHRSDREPWIQAYERDPASHDPNCQFCRYLITSPPRNGKWEAGKYHIVFHNDPETLESQTFRREQGFTNSLFTIYITLCYPPIYIFPAGPQFYGASKTIICHIGKPVRRAGIPQIVSPGFNVSLAMSWLDACNEKSHPECTTEYDGLPMPKTRLIDCSTRKLISVGVEAAQKDSAGGDVTQRPAFVALSYVWGRFENDKTQMKDGNLPSKLPLTIEDAILVTRKLNFRFLWVDQYCIDQSDEKDQAMQISHMDLIYKCADLTIIAAAGNDYNYGLPGVSKRAKDVMEPFILDHVLTFGILPQAMKPWECGKWHTRGWTFQEAHLSRRRLVFSDTAMHFECMRYGEWQKEISGGVECGHSEAVEENSERSQVINEWADIEPVVGEFLLSRAVEIYDNSSQPVIHRGLEASILSYTELVAQYTRRELTKASDGLNAFHGAANALTHFDPPVYSIAGIPFVVSDRSEEDLVEITFSYGLAWKAPMHMLVDNGDEVGSDVLSPEFPSWSWGNVGSWSVSWANLDEDSSHQRLATDTVHYPHGVQVEFNTGGSKELFMLTEFAEACRDSSPLCRRDPRHAALCFKAHILSARVFPALAPGRNKKGTWRFLAWGYKDLGWGFSGRVGLFVNVNDDPDDEQYDENDEAHLANDFQRRCSLEIDDDGLFEKVNSGGCSLMLLRCNSKEAQVLVLEWQDEACEHQRTARRIGILEFSTEREGKKNPSGVFMSCFSIHRDLRLI